MELIDYLRMLVRRWRWVLSLALVGLTLGATYIAVTPPTYEASASLYVGNGGGAAGDAGDDLSKSRFILERMDSYAALVDTPQVTRAVDEQLRLDGEPGDVAGKLSADVRSDTVVLDVVARDGQPDVAASIANVAAARLGAVIQLVEAPGTGAASPVKVTVTQPADAPGTPVSPDTRLALALGLAAGLGAGLLAAALREQAVGRAPRAGSGSLPPAAAPGTGEAGTTGAGPTAYAPAAAAEAGQRTTSAGRDPLVARADGDVLRAEATPSGAPSSRGGDAPFLATLGAPAERRSDGRSHEALDESGPDDVTVTAAGRGGSSRLSR